MRCLKIAACLAALIFILPAMAGGADVTYSGVPGKWKRASKESKESKSKEADPKPRENATKKIIDNGRLKVTVAPKQG